MTKTRAVGIDLGTTNSVVAYVSDAGHTEVIPNAEGEVLTPSVVLFDDAEIVVGRLARKAAGMSPSSVAQWVKRDMGAPVYSRPIRGDYMPPEAIQACILRQLQSDTARGLRTPFKAVITVPAYFDEPRRRATAAAGQMAGLDVLDIVNEPTAAALAFGEKLGYLAPGGQIREAMKVLVYDLGGGTFDVTLIDMKPGEFRTLATDGDVRLGGYDWDMRVLEFAATVFMQQTGADLRQDQGSVYKLMNEVEEAKKTLSARDQAKIRVDHAGHSVVVPITRQQFEEMTADLLNRTAYTTRQLVQTAGLAWNQVNRVLLVGGSTRMPMVPRMLKELTGVIPDHVVHPDEAVARGAALYAAFLLGAQDKAAAPQYSITNVNSHSLGIEGIDLATGRKLNKILIPRNSALPAKVTRKFVTKRAAQPSIVIHVLEGESTIPAACTSVGRAVIRNLPPDIPAGTAIQITYQYETNGRLKVTARIPGIGHETHLEMEREGQLSPQQVGRWRQVLAQNVPINSFEDAVKAELGLTRAS